MMTEDEVKQLCPKAENITITPDGTIGMKVGFFSQAINVSHGDAKRKVKDLYLDLMGMNREQETQKKAADSEYRRNHGG